MLRLKGNKQSEAFFLPVSTRNRVKAGQMDQITENLLSRVWQSRVLCNRELVTASGERLRVVHPGRKNSEGGPDFRHAIIATEGGELRGDVELHVKASGWQAHGHHRDPRYNGVILHVVMWQDKEGATLLQKGTMVPVLPLHHYLGDLDRFSVLSPASHEPCRDVGARLGYAQVKEALDEAGEERFRSKAGGFEAELTIKEEDQVLYEGLMQALGYSRNKESFQELARRMPLRVLQEIAQRERAPSCGAVLGAALWAEASLLQWHFLGVRPGNMPQRRIAGAGYLLARYLEMGLAQSLLQLVREADRKIGYRRLESGLVIKRDGYGTLIGRGRAREMVVNVLLPFAFARGDGQLKEHALELYRNYPPIEENQITRQMSTQLVIGSGMMKSARHQQGLIHLYNTLCLHLKCPQCPLMPA